jgi:hypothetical protein
MGKAFAVFTGVVVLGGGSAWAINSGLVRTVDEIKQSPGFTAGWSRAEQHPALLSAIGPPSLPPFSLTEFIQGRQRWDFTASVTETMETGQHGLRSVRSERNEIEVPIRGPSGRGQLTIHAAETPGKGWGPIKLEARIDGRGQPLDLLSDWNPGKAPDPPR